MAILNIGILAHVDAGKTSLTERILFETGLIREPGRVDQGNTQTDTLEIERSRGITVKAAVVSFPLGDLTVNLIDTPGHADFIAEVQRTLHVLDAVILVVSAVEGVQAQTSRLAHAIRACGLPTIIFVNKIDRIGARAEELLVDISRRLSCRLIPMNEVHCIGSRMADVEPIIGSARWTESALNQLAESSDELMEMYLRTGGEIAVRVIEREFTRQVVCGDIVPVVYGSAMLGRGVAQLLEQVETLLPFVPVATSKALSGLVFKILRNSSGEKLVYARLFSGEIRARDFVTFSRGDVQYECRVTAIERFVGSEARPIKHASTGDIVVLHGIRDARIGDVLGELPARFEQQGYSFGPPTVQSTIRAVDRGRSRELGLALQQLVEQDPLMNLQTGTEMGELVVHLYGEVQREVVAETLLTEYGLPVSFGDVQTICTEIVDGVGEVTIEMGDIGNPFPATVGIRVERGSAGCGVVYRQELGSLPLAYYRAIEETVYETLDQGLQGWSVTDCVVTLVATGYDAPVTTAADFRKMTPIVLMEALEQATTRVLEPAEAFKLQVPSAAVGAILMALNRSGATINLSENAGEFATFSGDVSSTGREHLERSLFAITQGEAIWHSAFSGYRPVAGEPPHRKRRGADPRNRAHYLASLAQM